MIPKELSERIEALLTRKNTGGLQWPDHCTSAINVGDLRALLTAAQGQEWTSLGPTNDRLIEIGYRDYVEPPQAEGKVD